MATDPADSDEPGDPSEPHWIPLDQNPHADDKRDVLDPARDEEPYKRLIVVALGIGLVVAFVVLALVVA